MTGKMSRNKGATFERYLASVLKLVWPDARRGRQYDSARECDVEGTPLRIEAKHYSTWPDVYGALKQAQDDNGKHGDNRPCVAITKKNRTQPTVTMFLCDFVKFMEESLYRPDFDGGISQEDLDEQ